MVIDIWSDIMCPFCYIGKRNLEAALQQFQQKSEVELVWHSFQLNPNLKYQPNTDIYTYLAEMKGQSREWSVKMHKHVTEMARKAGLTYNFDKAVVANSFDAHRLIQLAKKYHLGDTAEEELFKAYFTDGKNMEDSITLSEIGKKIGLPAEELKNMVTSNLYTNEVNADIEEAKQFGINAVPFFIFNRKYAISGAQPVEVFMNALNKSFTEWKKEKKL